MQRHSKRRNQHHVGGLLRRCVLFWMGPVLFLVLTTARSPIDTSSDDNLPDVARNVVPAFVILVLPSIANFGADCLFRCQGSLLIIQLFVQLVLIFFYLSQDVPNHMQKKHTTTKLHNSVVAPHTLPQVAATSLKQAKSLDQQPANSGEKLHAHNLETNKNSEKISVVLPCLNESNYAVKTVQSFCDRTPLEVLEEIIVVDDGSSPPLSGILKDIPARCRLKILRHKKAMGLMIAKQTGGDASTAKYIGFFDCHVAPRMGWERELISLLQEKPQRLVIPMIGDLNLTTWDEKPHGQLVTKCYITWNAEFWWYDDETNFVPVISGGLVATSQEWWRRSGGFDGEMRGWGGENTDQSLRAWLCGGDIVRAKSSIIAHMWRITTDPRTMSRYRLPMRVDNNARVVAMWYDEFAFKFRGGSLDRNIDVSKGLELKKNLGCKPYVYFLHRFRSVYLHGGMLPNSVFKIRSQSTQECLQKTGKQYQMVACSHGTWFHFGNQVPENFPTPESINTILNNVDDSAGSHSNHKDVSCGGHHAPTCQKCPQGNGAGWSNADCAWVFGECFPQKRVKKLKFMTPGKCCSGIREWNSIDCFDELKSNGPRASYCDVSGKYMDQHYIFEESGRIRHNSGKCVSLGSNRKLKSADCEKATRWERIKSFLPEETKIYHASVKKHGLTDDMPDK